MSEMLRIENLVQQFKLDKSILDKIKIKNGKVKYETRVVKAVNGISFTINKGEAFGLVGESGCGKSTTARTIIGLNKPTAGKMIFEGRDMGEMDKKERHALRKQMQMIFQDPYASLNPRMTVLEIVVEPILFHKLADSREEAEKQAYALLERVGIRPELASRYPHQFSGGQRQRIGIARALAVNPQFIIADEPVSALDVSIQAQILNLMMDLQEERGLSYLFIAHDLSVVRHLCSRLAVMYLGRIVEKAPADELFKNPMHPYTQALLSAIPIPEIVKDRQRILLRGEITSPVDPPDECRFAKRCNFACDKCRQGEPQLVEVSPNHFVSCKMAQGEF